MILKSNKILFNIIRLYKKNINILLCGRIYKEIHISCNLCIHNNKGIKVSDATLSSPICTYKNIKSILQILTNMTH